MFDLTRREFLHFATLVAASLKGWVPPKLPVCPVKFTPDYGECTSDPELWWQKAPSGYPVALWLNEMFVPIISLTLIAHLGDRTPIYVPGGGVIAHIQPLPPQYFLNVLTSVDLNPYMDSCPWKVRVGLSSGQQLTGEGWLCATPPFIISLEPEPYEFEMTLEDIQIVGVK